MTSRSRRKTLSHTDIECFLNEISSDENHQISRKRRTTMVSSDFNIENFDDSSILNSKNEILPPYNVNRELVREYCRMSFQQIRYDKEKRMEIAKKIVTNTTYKILPARLLYPGNFEHPASSMDGKKALLMSLGPSLDESEKQRKIDTSGTEEFTRCRVLKARGRSSFEYRDFDLDMAIPEEEYEKRYLLYLKSLRKDNDPVEVLDMDIVSATSHQPWVVDIKDHNTNVTGNNMDMEDDYFSMDNIDTSTTISRRNKAKDRRVTLSPASARVAIGGIEKRRQSMDLDLLPLLDLSDSPVPDSLPPIIDDFTVSGGLSLVEVVDIEQVEVAMQVVTPDEVSDHDKEVADFKDELDALLANSDDDDDCLASSPGEVSDISRGMKALSPSFESNIPASSHVSIIQLSPLVSKVEDIPNYDNMFIPITDSVDLFITGVTPVINAPDDDDDSPTVNAGDGMLATAQADNTAQEEEVEVELSTEEYLRVQHEKAYSRMRLRMEQSWWKYQWEVVSSMAVVTAKQGNSDKKT